MKILSLLEATFLCFACFAHGQTAEVYQWQPVAIGGGGYFTGVEFAPIQAGRTYLRSDVTGPWIRDALTEPWQRRPDHFLLRHSARRHDAALSLPRNHQP